MEKNQPGNEDFKYILQDISNIYLGAKFTYGELLENEDVPQKLREVILRIFLQEVAEDTTPENHLFFLTKDSASYRAYKKMRTKFRMSVWEGPSGKRKKAGYVNREYTVEDVLENAELQRKKDMIVVEEVHISKLGLASIIV